MNSFFSPINNSPSNKTRKIKGVAVLKLKKFGK